MPSAASMAPGIILRFATPLPDLDTEARALALCWRPTPNEAATFLLENGLLRPLNWAAFHAIGTVLGFSETAAEELSGVELPRLTQAERRLLFYRAYAGKGISADSTL